MAHPLLILIALLVAFSDSPGVARSVPPIGSTVWTLAPLLAAWILALIVIRHAGRTLDRTGSRLALARAEATARAFSVYLYIQAILAFTMLNWLTTTRSLTGDIVLLDEALAALPFLLALIAGWWAFAPIERRLIDATLIRALDEATPVHAPPSVTQIVTARIRHVLLIGVVILSIVLAWSEVCQRTVWHFYQQGVFPNDDTAELTIAIAQLAIAIPVLLASPLLVRFLWDTVPLVPGQLADRISAIANLHRVRFRRVLIWRTRGAMLNGAVVGLLPSIRYVLLTDAIIERLEQIELDAVIAHEIAHVKRRHLAWMLLATAVAAISAGVAVSAAFLAQPVVQHAAAHDITSLAASAIAGILTFGIVSRRFERQADAFAAQTLSERDDSQTITPESVRAMSAALRRVAALNHIRETRFGFRHGSIATRIRNLDTLTGRSLNHLPIDRTVRQIKITTILAAIAATTAIALL